MLTIEIFETLKYALKFTFELNRFFIYYDLQTEEPIFFKFTVGCWLQ